MIDEGSALALPCNLSATGKNYFALCSAPYSSLQKKDVYLVVKVPRLAQGQAAGGCGVHAAGSSLLSGQVLPPGREGRPHLVEWSTLRGAWVLGVLLQIRGRVACNAGVAEACKPECRV